MHSARQRNLIIVAAACAAAILLAVYGTIDPSTHFFPRCIFKVATGFDCPGCGSQRAIHALLTGRIAEAFRFNALLVASIPFLILMFSASLMKNRHPRLYNALNSRIAIITWAAVIILWWLLRNIL